MHATEKKMGLGKLLCLSVLIAGTLVKSTVGEALVYHQHGRMMAHIHVIGRGDLAESAAASTIFGHLGPAASLWGGSRTCTIAIIKTGSVFVSESNADAEHAFLLNTWFPISENLFADFDEIRIVDLFNSFPSPYSNKGAATALLLRNHTLLI